MFLSQHDRPRDNIVAEVCQQSSNLFRGYVDVYDVYGNICGTIWPWPISKVESKVAIIVVVISIIITIIIVILILMLLIISVFTCSNVVFIFLHPLKSKPYSQYRPKRRPKNCNLGKDGTKQQLEFINDIKATSGRSQSSNGDPKLSSKFSWSVWLGNQDEPSVLVYIQYIYSTVLRNPQYPPTNDMCSPFIDAGKKVNA